MVHYILAFLVMIMMGLGATSCAYKDKADRLSKELAVSEQQTQMWKDNTQAAINREVLANTRCVISQNVVDGVTDVNTSLDDTTNASLKELARQPHNKLLETIIDAKPITVADGARLSDSVMRLLNEAYCAGANNDSACPAIKPVPALQTNKSGK